MLAMCGILTFTSARRDGEPHRQAILEALESLHDRGPAETGAEFVGRDAVIGHKRLSIIAPAGSHEPLPYLDGRYQLIFNGEIYNYIELREELVREHRARFDTQGDGEVIVAGFHHWGEAVMDRLRGMFALVIVDTDPRGVFGARDPHGLK